MEDNHIIVPDKGLVARLLLPTLIICLLVATYAVYRPGLSGAFMLDDTHTLRALNKMGGITSLTNLLHFMTDGVGNIGRPLSMLFLSIDDQYFPGDPAKYRYTNLLIHLLCGLFLLLFALKISRATNLTPRQANYLAILVFAFWLLHPLNVSTTLYIVQRTTQAMSLFLLIGLTCYVYGRFLVIKKSTTGTILICSSVAVFGVLAFLCKENGVLICLYILILETTILRPVYSPKWLKYWLAIFTILPLTLLAFYLIYRFNSFVSAYAVRDFSMWERLLTESRILLVYLREIAFPPFSNTGLFHDDYPVSTSLLSPLSTLLCIIFIIVTITLAIRLRKTQPILSMSILWFFGGHILESTFIPLELYFEHRNYIPMIGPVFGIMYYCIRLFSMTRNHSARLLTLAFPLLLITVSSVFTYQSAKLWGNPDVMYSVWYHEHPGSLRAATMYAQVVEKHGNYSNAIEILQNTYKQHPDTVALLLYSLNLSCQSGIPIHGDINDIIEEARHATYRYALPAVTEQLISTVTSGNCRNISIDDLISLLKSLENAQRLRGSAKVSILMMLSDLYVRKGMLSPAVETLDRAYKTQINSNIPLQQAALLTSAGLYEDALSYINRAKLADEKRSLLKPSEIKTILIMEKQIKNRLENTNTSIK